MCEKMRREAKGEECKREVKQTWSIITVSEILQNDFYIGTLRQGKYRRKKINGGEVKQDETDHIVFENNHTPIVDYKVFALAQEQLKKRTTSHYRGVKKYDNVYSGYLFCGDCGSPMFAMSRNDLAPAYTCGTYHKRGTKGCTSHHTRVDMLDGLLKSYIKKVRDNSAEMIDRLQESIAKEQLETKSSQSTVDVIKGQIEDAKAEMKMLTRQQARDVMKHPDRAEIIEETYTEMIDELTLRIEGLKNQMQLAVDKHNTVVRVNRTARTVLEIFDDIINKPALDKNDLNFIIDKIVVFENRIEIHLKADIDCLLKYGTLTEQQLVTVGADGSAENFNQGTKIGKSAGQLAAAVTDSRGRNLSVNVISNGEGLDIRTMYCLDVASVVHDIGIKPAEERYGKGHCGGKLQEQLGPEPARKMLTELDFDEDIIDRVCFLIAHHHTYEGAQGLDWQILLEADFLVNAFEDSLSKESIKSFRDKVFKTKTGIKMLEEMYGV